MKKLCGMSAVVPYTHENGFQVVLRKQFKNNEAGFLVGIFRDFDTN